MDPRVSIGIASSLASIAAALRFGRRSSKSGGMRSPKGRSIPSRSGAALAGWRDGDKATETRKLATNVFEGGEKRGGQCEYVKRLWQCSSPGPFPTRHSGKR